MQDDHHRLGVFSGHLSEDCRRRHQHQRYDYEFPCNKIATAASQSQSRGLSERGDLRQFLFLLFLLFISRNADIKRASVAWRQSVQVALSPDTDSPLLLNSKTFLSQEMLASWEFEHYLLWDCNFFAIISPLLLEILFPRRTRQKLSRQESPGIARNEIGFSLGHNLCLPSLSARIARRKKGRGTRILFS